MKYKVGDIVWIELDPRIYLYSGPAKIVGCFSSKVLQYDYMVKPAIAITSDYLNLILQGNHYIKEKDIKYLVESG